MKPQFSLAAITLVALGLNVPGLGSARSVETWQGQQTSHFAIFTEDHGNSTSEILGRLETARVFFERTGLAPTTPQLSILELDPMAQPDVYRVNPAAYAFYQRTREGDFVIMRDLDPVHFPVAVHEYTHFVVEHAGLKLPLWLNEGLADFYSTLMARKAEVIVGEAPAGRENILSSRPWIEWSTLAAVDRESPYYRQADQMLLFYAQSWAMVHMLALEPEYEAGFSKFLQTVSAGATTDAAMTQVYHKNLEQIGQEVHAYLGSKRMNPRVVAIDVRLPCLEIVEVPNAVQRAEFALADILAANPQLEPEANRRLAALSTKYPDDPHTEESRGYVAMRAGQMKDAEAHFDRAVKQNSQCPDVWFRLAHLKLQSQGPTDEVVDLLERVIGADHDNYSARLELGFAAAKKEKYELAVKTLKGITNVKPEHDYVVSYTLAYCLVELQQGNEARLYAQRASKIAADNRDRNEVAGLMRYIDQESPVEVATREE